MARVAYTLTAVLCCLSFMISAQTTWTGTTDNDWNTTSNWTNGLPSSGNDATIPISSTPTLVLSATTVFDFNITNAGEVTLDLAGFNLNNGNTIINDGTFIVTNNGTFSNLGNVQNNGTWTSNSVFTNSFSASFVNAGTSELNGSTINFSTIENTAGSVTISGDFDNSGTITNRSGATVSVLGNFDHLAAYLLTNEGVLEIDASGIWSNYGDFVNTGSLTVLNQFINYSAATLSNNIGGTISNQGRFTNQGSIVNAASFENTSCQTFQGDAGSTATNTGAGTFVNNGIVRQIDDAVIAISSGTGTVLTNASDFPSPTMVCIPNVSLELDTNGGSTLTVSEIDGGSTADYCSIASRSISKTAFSCADIGQELVTLTVTDTDGVSNVCQSIVTIEDNISPLITSCPLDILADLQPGDCNETITYAVTATDNCGATITQIDATGYTSGDVFPEGITSQEYEITDGTTTLNCSFNIEVSGAELENDGLICNNQLNISLDQNCEYHFSPNLMLAGEDVCEELFYILINDEAITTLDISYVGQNVMVSVVNAETGNSCWGNALVEDKLPPQVENCDAVTLNCLQSPLPVSEGGDAPEPTFTDCSDFTSYYLDEMIMGDCGDSYTMIINRTWTATDIHNRTNTCLQVITVERILLSDVNPVCPTNYSGECTIGVEANTSSSITDYPTFSMNGNTYVLNEENNNACGFLADYSDQELPACDGSVKIVRTWLIAELCSPSSYITCTQMIDFMDNTGPIITTPENFSVTVGEGCVAFPVIPPATAIDCSSILTWKTQYAFGQINQNGGLVGNPGLGVGEHTITYIATDACGNTSTATLTITVVDDLAPVAVCDAATVVSLSNDGYGEVFAITFDDGSTDNCCLETVLIARESNTCGNADDLVFGTSVEFCCDDIGNETIVVLQVTDCYGNQNTCSSPVTVVGETIVDITCPQGITIECSQNINDLTVVGQATGSSNCGTVSVSYTDNIPQPCSDDIVVRTWVVSDSGGTSATCTQMITVINSNPLVEADIVCPANYEAVGCTPDTTPATTGMPVVNSSSCSTISTSYEDITFTNVAGYCMKIIRTWTITDDCVYSGVPNTNGYFQCFQTIFINNSEPPVVVCNEDFSVCNMNEVCGEAIVDLSLSSISDDCTPTESLQIFWVVDINNDGVADTGSNASGSGQNIGNLYPVGTHKITYTVKDACGNPTLCMFLFTVNDCLSPVAVCPNNIVIEIAVAGDTPLYASQIPISNSTDNCTESTDLTVYFSAGYTDVVRVYNCSHIGVQNLDIYVTDESGNQDLCTITVTVEDNMSVCPSALMIAGAIMTEEGNTLDEVMVAMESNEMTEAMTDELGHYEYGNATSGQDYTLVPHSNNDWMNGVSTWDAVLIRRHVLSIDVLTSPYQLIAADVNNSGSVTTIDALAIRSMVLQMTTEFPDNNSWRFIDADYNFPEPTNPWASSFPEARSLENLATSTMENNFIAVKIGDLNGTATTNGLMNEGEERTNAIFNLNTINQKLKVGEDVTVELTASDFMDIAAYQMTFNFDTDALDFISLNPGQLHQKANFGLKFLEHGAITCSWDNTMTSTIETSTSLFSVSFRAKKAADLSAVLNLNSRFTSAIAYRSDGENLDVQLSFSDENGNLENSKNFLLYQNRPNPFREETTIGFDLPQDSEVTLNVYDVSGKLVYTTQEQASIGYNEILINSQNIPTKGVFYYELVSLHHTATKKMIVTK